MCTIQHAQQPSLSELDDDIIDFFGIENTGGNPFDSMVTRDGDASPTFDELAADIANGTGDTHPGTPDVLLMSDMDFDLDVGGVSDDMTVDMYDEPAGQTQEMEADEADDSGDETEDDSGKVYDFPETEDLPDPTRNNAEELLLTVPEDAFNRPRGDSFSLFESEAEQAEAETSQKEESETEESETEESEADDSTQQIDFLQQAMDDNKRELERKEQEISRLRSQLKRKRNNRTSRSVRQRSNELRFDEYGEVQFNGNYLKDENDELYWSPPWGCSFDGLFYCHDPDCRRAFTTARTLRTHIWCPGNKYREGHDQYSNGRAGHNAQADESERYLMMRAGREFIYKGWTPYVHCPCCDYVALNRTNMLRHVKSHIEIPSDLPQSMVKDYIKEEVNRLLPKKKKGTALTGGRSKIEGSVHTSV